MKIVLANNFYYLRGGSERVLFEEKRILQENGHKVVPFSRAHPNNEYSGYANYFPPVINYGSLSLHKKMRTSIRLVYNRQTARAFLKVLKKFQPDIFHAHNIYGGLTTSILDAAAKNGVPIVMTLHDYKLVCPSYLMLNGSEVCEDCKGGRFYHCLLNRCHKESLQASAVYCLESYFNKRLKKYDRIRYLICPSRFLSQKLCESGFSKDRLVCIPNFVDVRSFKPQFGRGDYLLYVGRLSKEKGVLTLLEAVKKLDVPVKIVGDGPLRSEYEAFTRDNEMSHVVFEGYKSGEELKALFRNAAFLVFPSEWYENAPMTILEAFAYGKPVIGSRIGGIPEMIEPGRTGMLFEAGSADQLHECVKALWSNKPMISEMGRNARHKVESEFSPEMHYRKLMEAYHRAIDHKTSKSDFSEESRFVRKV